MGCFAGGTSSIARRMSLSAAGVSRTDRVMTCEERLVPELRSMVPIGPPDRAPSSAANRSRSNSLCQSGTGTSFAFRLSRISDG